MFSMKISMDAKTVDTYDKMARAYDDETSDFWVRFPSAILNAFAGEVKKSGGSTVLDVGSGPGRDGILLKEKSLDVTCLDASRVMVDMCKEKGLVGVVGDFNALPFERETFSGAWAYTSLIHMPKASIDAPLIEIARVLKPGGVLGLGVIDGDTEGYRENAGPGLPRWFSYYSRSEIDALLAKHGFVIVYFEEFKPGPRTYLNYICVKK